MAAGRCRRVRDATAPADLPSLVMIEVVGVSDRRHPGTLDESHQLGEPGDVRGVVSAWRGLGQRVKDKVGDHAGMGRNGDLATGELRSSARRVRDSCLVVSVSSEGLPTSVKFAVVTAMRQYPPEGLILGKARTLW